MLKPKFITFTGIDAQTDADRVKDLSARYPVEWGILFSRSNQGQVPRYPSLVEVGRFLDRCEGVTAVRFSAHICGAYSNEIMSKADVDDHYPLELIRLADALQGRFWRTQVNVADGETLVHEQDVRPTRADLWAHFIGAVEGAVVQCRGDFPDVPEVAWLYDRSGGAGKLPVTWNANAPGSRAFCGYAGGISAANVREVLESISLYHPDNKPFWIDMEGQVRTRDWQDDDWLDLDKCEAVLEAVYGKRK